MTEMTEELSRRDIALLNAVGEQRCEIVRGSLPVLFVDGRLSCDAGAARRLVRAGLLQRADVDRSPARLTEAGRTELRRAELQRAARRRAGS